jgi:hypothetical protein
MSIDFSLWSQAGLERERDEALDLLAAKIPTLEQLSNEVDALAHRVEQLRHEIFLRRSKHRRWNGRPTKIEIIDA